VNLDQNYFLLNETFRDYDDFAQSVRQWDLDFRQMDKGRFTASVLQAGKTECHIGEVYLSRKSYLRGNTPQGLRTFGALKDISSPHIWRGFDVTSNELLIFPDDGEIDAHSEPGFHTFTLSITEELLDEIIITLGVGEISVIIKEPIPLNCKPAKMAVLQNQLSQLSERLKNYATQMSISQILYEFEYEIPRALVLILTNDNTNLGTPGFAKRYRAIKRVKEYIEVCINEDITVRDLCKISGVSERTLQYAFMEYIGISPKSFVKINRLNHVRQELRNSRESEESISDIANRWGFWHMGQFATDYKKFFGELPSETKRVKLVFK
jgi:AraC family ethanolamine operon transcriptional activator